MLALQLLAAALLFLSAALFFGPQLVIYGPKALPGLARHPQARFIGGLLVTGCVFAVTAPHFASAVVAGGARMSMVALEVATMNFGVV